MTTQTTTRPRIRAATFADAEAVARLHQRNQMGLLDPAIWRSQWENYPLEGAFSDVPTGWVLETDDGKVVGSLDNVHLLYTLDDKPLRGVIAAGWAVDTAYRAHSLGLMTTFFRQPGVDLYLNVSASPAAAKVLTAMHISRIPIPDYATPCFWAANRVAFARAALLKRSIPGARLLAWPAALALFTRDAVFPGGRGTPRSSVRELNELDERFDTFASSGNRARLRAVRNRAVLEWRFRSAFRDGRAAIVVAEQGSRLLGYAVLVRRTDPDLGMDLFDVGDIQALNDDPSTFRDLLLGANQTARKKGATALKFMSGSPITRQPADQLRPLTYHLSLWQKYFKVASPEVAAKLSSADAWDFSWFDTF